MHLHRWSIIFNTGDKVWGFYISEKIIFLLIILIGIFSGALSYIILEGNSNKALFEEFTELKKENKKYLLKLNNINNEISILDRKFERVGFNNTLLLLASELTPVSKSVKQMGVGGPPERKEFYSLEIDLSVKNIEHSINRIEKLVELEKSSLENAEDKLTKLKRRLLHTPSIWPTYGYVTDGFGWRRHPITKRRQWHEGYDIANYPGTPVIATADGVIKVTKWWSTYGNTIRIDHGFGIETRYAHLKNIYVRPGQEVKRGQKIGCIGSTGRVTGPHLHYEVRVLNQAVNPYDYLDIYKNTY
jgi:murein DD-endopeptidase MepM/ murein hydrolase activator NlpD